MRALAGASYGVVALALVIGGGAAAHGNTLGQATPRVSKPEERSRTPEAAELSVLLDRARLANSSAHALSAKLEEAGLRVLPALLDVLTSRKYEADLSGAIRITHALDGALFEGAQSAVAQFPWASVRAELEGRIGDAPSLRERGRALALMGAVLPGEEILLLDLALAQVDRREARALQELFCSSAEEILARGTAGDPHLPELFASLHPRLLSPMIKVLHSLGGARGACALSRLMNIQPEADPLVLIELADLSRTVQEPLPDAILDPIRRSLGRVPMASKVEAVKTLGRLDDVAAIPMLIPLLNSEHKPLATAACRSLELLSRERHGMDQDAWNGWFEAAQAWLNYEAPGALAAISGADRKRARRALMKVARYRVFRHSLVDGVKGGLSSPDKAVVELTCAVLGHFATEQSIPPLLGVLGSNRPKETRKAAFDALVRATGQNHGEHVRDWVAAGWSE